MGVPRISKEDLKAQLDADAASAPLLLDVRLKYPYEHSTMKLPGAVRMLPDTLDLSALSKQREIVAYDSDPDEITSARIVAQLVRQGYRARALQGGIVAWIEAKLPTETKEAPQMKVIVPGSLK